MSNLQTLQPKKFSVEIQKDTYKNLINQTLGDKDRATRFIASISSAVATIRNRQILKLVFLVLIFLLLTC